MYDRALGQRHDADAPSTGPTAKASRVAGGGMGHQTATLAESSGLGSRKGQTGHSSQRVSEWLGEGDLQTTAQPASWPGREEFGVRRRAGTGAVQSGAVRCWLGWSQSGMQDGNPPKPREEDPGLGRAFLPWSRRQLSEAGQDQRK